jgi:hypothetical protein
MARAKVVTIPARPEPVTHRKRKSDPRFIEGQRVIVDAMRYLAQSDLRGNRPAIELLSEHFRTQFRMSDTPMHLAES